MTTTKHEQYDKLVGLIGHAAGLWQSKNTGQLFKSQKVPHILHRIMASFLWYIISDKNSGAHKSHMSYPIGINKPVLFIRSLL